MNNQIKKSRAQQDAEVAEKKRILHEAFLDLKQVEEVVTQFKAMLILKWRPVFKLVKGRVDYDSIYIRAENGICIHSNFRSMDMAYECKYRLSEAVRKFDLQESYEKSKWN